MSTEAQPSEGAPAAPEQPPQDFAAYEAMRQTQNPEPSRFGLSSRDLAPHAVPDGGAAPPEGTAEAKPEETPAEPSGGPSKQAGSREGDPEKTPEADDATKAEAKPAKASKAEARMGQRLRRQQKEIDDLKKQIEELSITRKASPETVPTPESPGDGGTNGVDETDDGEDLPPDPDDYASVEAWQADLDRWTQGETVAKPATAKTQPSTAERSERSERAEDDLAEPETPAAPASTRAMDIETIKEMVDELDTTGDLWDSLIDLREKGRFFLTDEMANWLAEDDSRFPVLAHFADTPRDSLRIAKVAGPRQASALERLLREIENPDQPPENRTASNPPVPDALRGPGSGPRAPKYDAMSPAEYMAQRSREENDRGYRPFAW